MQRLSQRLLVAGFAPALLLLVFLAVHSASASSYTLNPLISEVHTGKAIDFAGTGFIPGERVSFWLTLPDQTVVADPKRVATAGENGSVLVTYAVPWGAPGGTWAITLYGEESRMPVITHFTVIDGDNVVPIVAAFPPAAPSGSYFGFYALGLEANEQVSYWISAPGGVVFEAFPSGAYTDDNGRVNLAWTSPAGVKAGTWVLTVQGLDSGRARAIPFEVQ